MNRNIIEELTAVLEQRKLQHPDDSYVASLHNRGLNKILEKVGEEATETILAAKDAHLGDDARQELIKEVADLWFHSMVMLSHLDMTAAEVLSELEQRFGIGGHEEKRQRTT